MTDTSTDLQAALRRDRFPRSSGYDPTWLLDRIMGPHPLWLLEDLLEVLPLRPGMRVLDLGAGYGLTSAFLAREYDVDVIAADTMITPADIAATAAAQDVAHRVIALDVDAHQLPLAPGSLDAIVSIDAYHYFGTDDLYLDHLAPLLRPDGLLGVVSPSTTTELHGQSPPWIEPFWVPGYRSFHTPDWWRHHWETSGQVTVDVAEHVTDGATLWLDWLRLTLAHRDHGELQHIPETEQQMLEADAGHTFRFARLVARKR